MLHWEKCGGVWFWEVSKVSSGVKFTTEIQLLHQNRWVGRLLIQGLDEGVLTQTAGFVSGVRFGNAAAI